MPDLIKTIDFLPEGYAPHGEARGGKTVGLVFKNVSHNTIIFKKGDLGAKYMSKQVDHVSFTKNGSQYVTIDGGIIYENRGTILRKSSATARPVEIPAEEIRRLNLVVPSYHPDVHIPLDIFIKKFGGNKCLF